MSNGVKEEVEVGSDRPSTSGHRVRNVAVLVGVLLVALAVAVWAVTPLSVKPRLESPGGHPVTEGAARIHQGQTVTIGSMFACLDKAGSVTITDVSANNPVGLKVTGWAVRPNPFWKSPPPGLPVGGQIGVARNTLAELKFPSSHKVDAKCGNAGQGYEIAVQVVKTTSGEAGASGWLVTYNSGGNTKQFGYPIAVKLCNEQSADSRQCRALKV